MRFPIGRERATFHGSKPELESIPKEFMTEPTGNSEFCFPSTLNAMASGKE